MDKNFSGVYTALITPFLDNGSIDWAAFEKLLDRQIQSGVAGVVPCGTTGEAPTLTEKETLEVIQRTIKQAKGKIQVIAGTGSNNTAHAVSLTRHAEELGADACLVVNPYYNKPTQEGLYRHFKSVAQSVKIPIVVYNIKGRTAVNIETDTLMRIAGDCSNVTAVKEASGDFTQMQAVLSQAPKAFSVLSGDDNMTLKLVEAGGKGVVSVISNILPKETCHLVDAALKGDLDTARKIDQSLSELYQVLFIETNPIPVKAASAMLGLCKEIYRLPMCEMRPGNREKLAQALSRFNDSNKKSA